MMTHENPRMGIWDSVMWSPTVAIQGDAIAMAQDRLIMYCRPWCGHCGRAREWLAERGIEYVEIDVEQDPVARERAASLNDGRLHTPTFECGTETCVDFRPDRLCEILGIEL